MNNLPLFTKRYAPDLIPPTLEYVDTLLLLLLIAFAIGALLLGFSLNRRKSNKSSTTLPLIIYSSLQTLLLIGLSYALAIGQAEDFWLNMTKGLLAGTLYLIGNSIFYLVSWLIFTSREALGRWFVGYFQLWSLLGIALYIPVLLSLGLWGNNLLYITLLIILYLLFRLGIIGISIHNFPMLLRRPLHIILYLCTCEIAPLLFLFG